MPCLLLPAKRVWRGLRARIGLRRTTDAGGLGRLRKQVRACEYSDVHVMWEMLGETNSGGATTSAMDRVRAGKKKKAAAAVSWSRLSFYCCGI